MNDSWFPAALDTLNASAQTIDLEDPEPWLDCYTDDGVFRFQPEPGAPDFFRLEGRADRSEWFAQHRARVPAGAQTHIVVNPRLRCEGEDVMARSTYMTLFVADGRIVVASSGLWIDRLVRSGPEEWKIAERAAVRVMPRD